MKVSELIEKLQKMPQEADVCLVYDGRPRLDANVIYESIKGEVLLTDFNEPVYENEDWPCDYSGDAYPYNTPKV